MAANLFGTRFSGKREPAWHQKGTVFHDSPALSDAFTRTGLDYPYLEAPVTALLENKETGIIESIPVDGRKAILRGPTPDDPCHRALSVVSNNYTVLQNMELAALVEPLAKRWPVETVGALGKGETVFVTLDAGEAEIGRETIRKFFLLTDTKDGTGALDIAATPVRVVCMNTLQTALAQATTRFSLGHHMGIRQRAEWAVDAIARLERRQQGILGDFQAFTEIKVNPDELPRLLKRIYPEPTHTQPYELVKAAVLAGNKDPLLEADLKLRHHRHTVALDHTIELRHGAEELLLRFNDEQPPLAWTAWALYNACVELADFREGKGDVAASALWGRRAAEKARAYTVMASMRN